MRKTISRILNLLIAVFAIQAWLSMTFRLGAHGSLSAGSFYNLKYFTVLSNLFQAFVSLFYFAGRRPRRFKYASTTAVALTFFVVLFFLGPIYGYASMYAGASFWLHLVVPVLAMLDFLFLDREGTFTLRDSLFAMIPMTAYGLYYVGNLIVNGVKDNDWYRFATGGLWASAMTFLVIVLANWAIALLLRLPRRERKPQGSN